MFDVMEEFEARVLPDADWQSQERMKLITKKRYASHFEIRQYLVLVMHAYALIPFQCILRTCALGYPAPP